MVKVRTAVTLILLVERLAVDWRHGHPSAGLGQPGIVEPFSDLRGGDPRAVRVLRVDEDIEFLRNDHRRDHKERGGARAYPIRAEFDARPAGRFGVPTDRQAGRTFHLRTR